MVQPFEGMLARNIVLLTHGYRLSDAAKWLEGPRRGCMALCQSSNTWPKRPPCCQSLFLCELGERLKWGRSPITSDLKVLLQAALPHHKVNALGSL